MNVDAIEVCNITENIIRNNNMINLKDGDLLANMPFNCIIMYFCNYNYGSKDRKY